jgi:hypothetical protein
VVALQGHTKIKSDYRSAAEYVKEDGRGDLFVFLLPQGRPVFDYYYGDQFGWMDAPYTNSGMGAQAVAEEMAEATQGYGEVWLVVSESELWDKRELVQQWLDDNGTLLGKRSYARVDLFLYSLRQEGESSREVC